MQIKILSGLSGSGKTTFWQEHFPGAFVVSADGFFCARAKQLGLDYHNGGEGFDPSLLTEAHADCFRRFLSALEEQAHLVVVDNCNTSAWEIAPYVLAGAAYGYGVEILRLHCDPDTAMLRNVHGVPIAAFEDRTLEDGTVIPGMVTRFNARDVLPFWNVTDMTEEIISAAH